MRRGEIWSAAGGAGYAGKPRPVAIVQDDRFDSTNSITVCAFTTSLTDAPLLRVPVEPSPQNGLLKPSNLMVDKITTVQRGKLGERLGVLSGEDMVRLDRSMVVFLGLAGR